MTRIWILEEKSYDRDNYSEWHPDTEVAFATEALAQAEANKRNAALLIRNLTKHIKGQRDRIAGWDRAYTDHNALYEAGLREGPLPSSERPTYKAPPLDRRGFHRLPDEGTWEILDVPLVGEQS